jgi:uroporphyrin-III C-methyltransferase
MGVSNLPYIKQKLVKYGKDTTTPVAVIHWGTTDVQSTVTGTLENIYDLVKQQNITNPSMIIVGEVVNLRNKLSWYEDMLMKNSQSEALSL